MADISMCSGEGCELKETCYRHTAKSSDYQSFFGASPNSTPTECEYYWKVN